MGANRTGDALKSIYQSDPSPEIKKEAIKGLARTKRARVHAADAKAWIIDQVDSLERSSKRLIDRARKELSSDDSDVPESEAAS